MKENLQIILAIGGINIAMLLMLLQCVIRNYNIAKKRIQYYAATIVMTIIVIAAEFLSLWFNEMGPQIRIGSLIVNIVGFGVSVCIPSALALLLDQKFVLKVKYFSIPVLINWILLLMTPWTKTIFYITQDNHYMRGPLFWVYVVTYLFNLCVLFFITIQQCKRADIEYSSFIFLLYVVVVFGTSIQVFFPNIYVTWHCVTLALIMYYVFLREIEFRYDVVTGSLNRHAYEIQVKKFSEQNYIGIIMLDLDDFKQVNDQYGHAFGDECLSRMASLIRNVFRKAGNCYRIGGDEFCVLIRRVQPDMLMRMLTALEESNDQSRRVDSRMPNLSYGFAIYTKQDHDTIYDAIEEADKKMYFCKKQHKMKIRD